VIVVNPVPDIDELPPAVVVPVATDTPPAPTVAVITFPFVIDCVEVLKPPAPPPPKLAPPPPATT